MLPFIQESEIAGMIKHGNTANLTHHMKIPPLGEILYFNKRDKVYPTLCLETIVKSQLHEFSK